ncbi:MAG: zinc-binding dehydrogenase [Candidatus Omnitrophota bacterium]
MNRTIKAVVFEKPGQITLKTFHLPPCGPEEIICKTIYSFVSPGTELRILGGQKESKGRFPLIPGYAWVGRVVETGANLRGWDVGEMVTGRNPLPVPGINALWGGQASLHRVEVSGYDCVLKLPADADPWHYVHAEVAAISWRGTSIAYPAPGETAVVIGQGIIGAFAARWLIYHKTKVMVVDLEESRLKQARKWGAAAAFNGREPDVREQILNRCPGGVDIVIEASASLSGVKLAGSLLRQPAPRVLSSNYPIADMHTNAHLWPRLVLLATYSQTLETEPGGLFNTEGAVVLKPGDRTVGDRREVIERIRCGDLPISDIVEAPVPVEDAPAAYARLRDNPAQHNALAFRW